MLKRSTAIGCRSHLTKDELLKHPSFVEASGDASILIAVNGEIGWLQEIYLDTSDRDALSFEDGH